MFCNRYLALSLVRVWEESQSARSAVEGSSGHTEVERDLGRHLSAFDKPTGVADLAVGDDPRATAKILAGCAVFGNGVDNALSLDFVFHLPECRHDRERHGPHRCRGVDVTATRVQHAETCAAAVEILGEVEHVLRRSTQPVQSRDDESVAILESIQRAIEVRPRCSGARNPLVDIEVVAPDTRGQDIGLLPVGGLLARRYSRVADQFRHSAPGCFITNGEYRRRIHGVALTT
jgi:hypothetical protein